MQTEIIFWSCFMKNEEHDYFKQLGKRIAQIRKEQGLTQTQLGNLLNLSQQIIASYEAGRRHVSVWRLFAIAEALGMDSQNLLQLNGRQNVKRGPTPKLQKQIEQLKRLPKGKQMDMPEVFENFVSPSGRTCVFPVREHWIDIGRIDDYHNAQFLFHKYFEHVSA